MIRVDLTGVAVRNYLVQFRNYYPGILEWYPRVEAELATGRRRLFSAWIDDEIAALAITRNGPSAKLCHISVSPAARDRGLGGALMQRALHDMRSNGAHLIRVTTSEEVLRNHGAFFRAAGFEAVDWRVHRYRRGRSEILWQMGASRSVDNSAPLVAGHKGSATQTFTSPGPYCAYCAARFPRSAHAIDIPELDHFLPKSAFKTTPNEANVPRFVDFLSCCQATSGEEHAASPIRTSNRRWHNTDGSSDETWGSLRHKLSRNSAIDEPGCSERLRHPR